VTLDPRPILLPALRRPVAVVAMVAALVVVALGVIYGGTSSGGTFDRWLQPWLDRSTAALHPLALSIDFCGEPVGLAVLVVALTGVSLWLRRPRMAVLVLVGTGLSITATTVIKQFAGRTIHETFLSYPSGHTASATAMAMAAVMLGWHRLRPVAAFALLMGVALVVGAAAAWAQAGLVAHYPTDTIGGWCTALAVVPATAWLIDRIAAGWKARQRPPPGDPARTDRPGPDGALRRSGGTPA
jgi:membrane-associated phospholipid phosphatase